MNKSLRTRLTLFFIAVAIVPLLFLAGLIAWQGFGTVQDQAITLQQAVTHHLAAEVGAFLNERQNELQILVEMRGLGTLNQPEQQELLAGLLARQPAYQELALLDETGQEQIRLSRSEVVTLISRAGSEAFLEPMDTGKIYYGSVRFDETIREPLMTIAVPLVDLRSGETTNVLLAELRFKAIWDLLGGFHGGQEYTYVVDSSGAVVAHRDPSIVLGQTKFSPPVTNGGGRFKGLSGPDVILAATPVEYSGQDLIAVAEQPYREASALAINLVTIVILVTAVALGGAIIAGIVIIRQIVSPIEKLSTVAHAVQEGDLSQTVEITNRDEIGQLAQTFNSMTAQLRETIADLEQSQARFRNIIESVPIGMYMHHLDSEGQLIFDGANPAAGHMLGVDSNELVGLPVEAAFPVLTETELPDRYREIATEGTAWQTELMYPKNMAKEDPGQDVYQVYAFQTSPDNMVAAFLDVSDRKRAEEERARLQQEVIEAQKQAIQELSTPVIPLMDRIIVMPMVGSIDSMRARDITRSLLAGISKHKARIVILDVTGVSLMDTGIVNYLNKTIQAAQLKGAQTIVTGISDAVAESIVDLGIDWSAITTLSDLQTGLLVALENLGLRIKHN